MFEDDDDDDDQPFGQPLAQPVGRIKKKSQHKLSEERRRQKLQSDARKQARLQREAWAANIQWLDHLRSTAAPVGGRLGSMGSGTARGAESWL